MKPVHALTFLFAWLVCLVGSVQGQTIEELLAQTPQCAISCFASEVLGGGCTTLEYGPLQTCLCPNTTMLTGLTACVRLSCDVQDQIPSEGVLDEFCQGYPEESQATKVRVVTIVTIAVTIPSIALRCVARYKTSQLGWDDYTAMIAAVCLVIPAIITLISTFLGFGRHVWDVNPRDAIPLLQLYWIIQQFYIVEQFFIKISILALYARVFPARWFKLAVRTGIVFISVQDIIYLFCTIFRCSPIQAIWDVRQPGRCFDLNLIGITGAILGITEHFIILLLPLPELWKLNLSWGKRLELAAVFIIGSFSCVTSVIRLKHVAVFAPTADLSWDTVPVVLWSLIEDLSAVVCINLPPCRHLLGKLFPDGLFTRAPPTLTGGTTTRRRYGRGKASCTDHSYARSIGVTNTTTVTSRSYARDDEDPDDKRYHGFPPSIGLTTATTTTIMSTNYTRDPDDKRGAHGFHRLICDDSPG